MAPNAGDRAASYCNAGNDRLARGDFDGASAAYQQAIRFVPTWGAAYRGLGIAYAERNLWAESERALRHALVCQAGDPHAAGYLGIVLSAQRRDSEALPFLEMAAETLPHWTAIAQYRNDARHNCTTVPKTPRWLMLRHPTCKPQFYQLWLDWVALNFPNLYGHVEWRLLPCTLQRHEEVALVVPWLQDPVQQWSEPAYRQACALARQCQQYGIPTINPVDRLTHASKLEGTKRIARAGFRTPRMVAIANPDAFKRDAGGLTFPLFIREDWGHGNTILRVKDKSDLPYLSLEGMKRPIAVEIVDVRGADGLYRKYRYCAAGDRGVSHHLIVTPHWVTRGQDRIFNEATQAEELAYISAPDPHHDRFQAARRALELDFVAFDYGYDRDGNVVVWEANPYPYIHFSGADGRGQYRQAAIHRTLAAMLALYLERAGLPVPPVLETILDTGTPDSDRAVACLRQPPSRDREDP